ncbi:MAG: transporter substrate-binding domain-containing protein [Limimaricola sp.]|uniref:transporter substrate-binding domain-containing protein n=1 Tax=Limimaricola sp. TaxID=2211665 RepID=UPI001DA2781A|nr:transporter substrate-binding domain-containing protein [Limimaricola sp.]MBI1416533.1 transporter substrate-binding domain-containing protein [Limimaricola sp.]
MKKLILSLAALALSAGMAAAQTDPSVVRLATEGAYPPYNFINDKGEVDGFERELGDELCKRAELNCTWTTNAWDSIIPNLVSGNYDVIIAGMSITPEREQVIAFSDPYTQPDPSAFLAKTGNTDFMTGTIAAQTGTIQAAYVTSNMPGASLLEFATADETVAAVKNGEADAVLADKAYLQPIADADPDLAIEGGDQLIGGGVGLGMRQSDTELKAKFDAAIQSMKADGSLNAMIKKWLPDSAPFPS